MNYRCLKRGADHQEGKGSSGEVGWLVRRVLGLGTITGAVVSYGKLWIEAPEFVQGLLQLLLKGLRVPYHQGNAPSVDQPRPQPVWDVYRAHLQVGNIAKGDYPGFEAYQRR